VIPNRRVVVGIVGILLLISFFSLVHAGFAVPDDFLYSLMAHSDKKWQFAWDTSRGMGRFGMVFHIALNLVPYAVRSVIYLKIVQIGSMLATLLLFAHTVARFSGRRDDALLCTLCFAAFLPNMWEHHIYAAYPFVFQFGGFFLLLSLLAFRDSLDDPALKHRVKAALFLLVAALTYEAFLAYLVVFLLIAAYYRGKDGLRAVVVASAPVALATIVYLQVYIVWRSIFPSTYAGSQISTTAVNLVRAARVVWQFSAAALPGYVFAHFDQIHCRFPGSPLGFARSVGALLANLQVEWLVKAVLVGIGVWLLVKARQRPPEQARPAAALALGAVLFVLPAIPLAVTPKYQEWVASGAQAYVVTYFAYFGVVLLLAVLAMHLGSGIAGGGRRATVAGAAVAAVFASFSLVTDYGNQAMNRSQALNRQRWDLFAEMVSASDFAAVPSGSCLLIDGLRPSLVMGNYAGYLWEAWIEQRVGRTVTVLEDRGALLDCMHGGRRPGFLLRYRQEENAANQFIALARVEESAGAHLVGSHAVILWSGTARRFDLLLGSADERPNPTARIDGAAVTSIGNQLRFPVDSSTRRSGFIRTEVDMPHLVLDTVSAATFPE
jgi:hypothetical protein